MSREYPDHPRVAVGVVVIKDRHVLLIRRAKPPQAGSWSLPGGGQELGEPIAKAAQREVLEETGIEIATPHIVEVVDSIRYDAQRRVRFHYTIIDFAAHWVSGTPSAGDDAADAKWVPLTELGAYGLWQKTIEVIEKADAILSATGE